MLQVVGEFVPYMFLQWSAGQLRLVWPRMWIMGNNIEGSRWEVHQLPPLL